MRWMCTLTQVNGWLMYHPMPSGAEPGSREGIEICRTGTLTTRPSPVVANRPDRGYELGRVATVPQKVTISLMAVRKVSRSRGLVT
jgi:hypothetical protein